MALYTEAMVKQILGLATYVHDWKVGLYYQGQDPLVDLVAAEVTDSRVDLPEMAWDTTYLANTETIVWGPLPSCTVGGLFVVNGTETLIAWSKAFTTPISVGLGEYLTLDAGLLTLSLE